MKKFRQLYTSEVYGCMYTIYACGACTIGCGIDGRHKISYNIYHESGNT